VRPALSATRNILKVLLLDVAACGLLGLIGWELGGYRLLSVLVFSGLLISTASYWYADRVVIGLVRAVELPIARSPGLHSTVERLAARAGVAKPKLYLIDDGFPRALSAGRGPRSSSLAVSSGLLAATPPTELDAVLAHELVHIRNRDVIVQTTAVVIASTLVEASRIGGFLERSLLFVLGPVASAFVHLLLSERREFEADRGAAWLCDSPHGIADALTRLELATELVDFAASPTTEPLYTVNPFADDGLARMFVTHPPVDERVQRLRDLDPEWREKLRAA
jgi:heat shock protein HtpX